MCVIFGIPLAFTTTTRAGGAVEVRAASAGHRGSDHRGIWMDRDAPVALEHPGAALAR
jgi:asparagine synthetase B (glutamine-hydrolysing)